MSIASQGLRPISVVILGAGGYLGSALCAFFHALPGHTVIAVARRPPNHARYGRYVRADVFTDDWAPQIVPAGPLILINCAFDFTAVASGGFAEKYARLEHNIAALAQQDGTRLINVSTMSAYRGCVSDYGREKLFVEELFARYRGLSVRPGLIVSWGSPGTAFLNLISTVRGAKLVPLLSAPNSGFYICDLDAVVLGIFGLTAAAPKRAHTLSFCYRQRLKLREVLRIIEGQLGVNRILVPLPWRVAYLLLRAKESVLGVSKVRADSVRDFATPNPLPAARGYFARLVARVRADLESPSHDGAFTFLEPRRSQTRPAALEPEVMAALAGMRDHKNRNGPPAFNDQKPHL